MKNFSVIITTYNEGHNIEAVLKSISFADEIIVVDSFSEDDTVALAKKYTDQIIQRKYIGPADQKNWAIPQAKYEWVLILDADERVTPELKLEIQSLLNTPTIPFDAFWIKRQNFFMGKQVRYSGWQNDAVIRLIHRDKCRYNSHQVHEEIETRGIEVGKLTHPMLHYTFKDSKHFLAKIERYAVWSAKDHQHQSKRVTWFHLFLKPLFRFFKHFIAQRGFLDGKTGFVISVIMAWSVFFAIFEFVGTRTKEFLVFSLTIRL